MSFALRTGLLPLASTSRKQVAIQRVHHQQKQQQQCRAPRLTSSSLRSSSISTQRLKVAAIDQPETYQPKGESPADVSGGEDSGLEQQALLLQQLDVAQEDLLKWMLFLDSDAQEADLDEAVDQEEVGDEEFEGLYDEVETMLEESGASFKVGDKVFGTVYEVDEDGAYVEIGAKTAGFVPLAECSLGRLKTVSRGNWERQGGQWACRRGAPSRRRTRVAVLLAAARRRRRRLVRIRPRPTPFVWCRLPRAPSNTPLPPTTPLPPPAPRGAAPRHAARVCRCRGRGRVRGDHPLAGGDRGERHSHRARRRPLLQGEAAVVPRRAAERRRLAPLQLQRETAAARTTKSENAPTAALSTCNRTTQPQPPSPLIQPPRPRCSGSASASCRTRTSP
jgi:hypothetical protein